MTVPFDDTVATSELLVVHVTDALMMAPDGSRTTAVNATVPPRGLIVADEGVTVIVRTPGVATVTVALPDCPSLVAVIVAVPADTPVTTPALVTVATAVWLLDQDTTLPLNALPAASLVTAVSCVVWPIVTEAVDGETVTLATATGTTVTLDQPSTPSMLAKITALPALTALTSPEFRTSATLGVLLVHTTVRPVSGWPVALNACAVSMSVRP